MTNRAHVAIVFALGIALLSGAIACSGSEADDRPPSVVLIVIDTLRRDHLSLHGYSKATSPGLERLAEESVVFDRCLAPSSWTKPSTASLMTGLYLSGHRAWGEHKASLELEFLAELLAEKGYATAGFSGNPYVSEVYDMDQGFAHFQFSGGKHAKDYPDITELLTAARGWLDTAPRQPFFLYLHLMNVHGPYRSPEPYSERFLEQPAERFEFQSPAWNAVKVGDPNSSVTQAQLNSLSAQYDGAIAYTDEQISLFIEELRTRGLLDESVLVLTSDHGEEFYEHESFGHRGTLYSEVVDVPLLLRLPLGREGGRRVAAAVSLIDVPATILDVVGILDELPAGHFGDGISLLEELGSGEEASTLERPLLSELSGRRGTRRALLQRWPHRLARIPLEGSGRRFELYNVELDPLEQHDISAERPQLLAEMKSLFAAQEDRIEPAVPATEEVKPDNELRRRLEALGYVE